MAVGGSALLGAFSYIAVGRETTQGTYNTATAALDVLNASIKTTKDVQTLEQIETSRTYSQQISLSKTIEGEFEFYMYPQIDAINYILQNAFGGTVTSATATGETVGGGSFTHIFSVGNMDQSYPSLCLNVRKGTSAGGMVFEYWGVRVNTLTFSSEVDAPLKCGLSVVAMDSTQTSNDVASALSINSFTALTFVDGRVSVEATYASLTSSSIWHVESFELSINNNLKSDSGSRRIGSDALDVLPAGVMSFELKTVIRFDTTTAYDAMINETQLAMEIEFAGSTFSGSVLAPTVLLEMPKVFIRDAGDPEIGGPDEVLKSEVIWNVLRDNSSSGGYAIRASVTNQSSSYA